MDTKAISRFQFPPGIRFHPSDEELIVYYLLNKVNSRPLPAAVIGEIELYSFNPWDLPKKAPFGDEEWYFFSPRDRKYPNGARPNRTAASGYWKATGTDKPILNANGARIGVKKALVFYVGKPPNGVKTDWIMIEYRLPDSHVRPSRSKGSMRLDEWVLCRIKQKGNMSKNSWAAAQQSPSKTMGEVADAEEYPSSVNPHNPNNTTTSDMCTNYFLSKDCQLLAELFGAHDFPSIQAADDSSASQSSNIDNQSCSVAVLDGQHGTIKNLYHHRVEANNMPYIFGGSLGQLGGKHYVVNTGYENDDNPSPLKKAIINLNKNENLYPGSLATTNGTGLLYNQHHLARGDMCKLNLSSPMPNLPELDVYTFAQRFLQ